MSEVSEATSITTGTRTDGPGGNHFPSEPWDESFTTGRFLTPASQSSDSVSYPSSKFGCGKLSQVWPLLWVSSGKFSKLSQVGERLRARAMGNAIWKVCIYIAVKLKLQWRIFFEKILLPYSFVSSKAQLAAEFRSFGSFPELNSGCFYDFGVSPELKSLFSNVNLIFQ